MVAFVESVCERYLRPFGQLVPLFLSPRVVRTLPFMFCSLAVVPRCFWSGRLAEVAPSVPQQTHPPFVHCFDLSDPL